MKTALIIGCILIFLYIIFQSYDVFARSKTKEQPYKVIRVEKNFEIRYYPPATIATVNSNTKSFKELGGFGFRKLANYIFGGNETKKQIAMTSPVQMMINDSIAAMSFVMPEGYNKDNLPMPNDINVNISTTNPEYVAAIRFSGFASDNDIKLKTDALKAAIESARLSYYGSFRFLGYNPPYQLFGRRNEIIVSIYLEENISHRF